MAHSGTKAIFTKKTVTQNVAFFISEIACKVFISLSFTNLFFVRYVHMLDVNLLTLGFT